MPSSPIPSPTRPAASSATARTLQRDLSTGQTIFLTPQEERVLRRVYGYMAGLATRQQIQQRIADKKNEIAALGATNSSENAAATSPTATTTTTTNATMVKSYRTDQRSAEEIHTDVLHRLQDELLSLEEKYRHFEASDHVISLKDIEALLRHFGATMSKKQIEYMLWEVDERSDGVIDSEELYLTYYRNIVDTTGCEPSALFHVVEFLTFDERGKGYIVEDDCMEILFARHGSAKLESELQYLFRHHLRAAGGSGTLTLPQYLEAVLERTGRRAVVP